MPHSGGGGHHGGGHHGGSHHSRGGGGSRSRTSSTHFPGARRFVYYKKNSMQPQYVYSDTDITKGLSKSRLILLLFYIPFFIVCFVCAFNIYSKPNKLSWCGDGGVYIEDNVGVLEDTEELESILYKIYSESGISPAIITVYNEDWEDNYTSLENYAYDLYVNNFLDEKHYLLVYSVPMYDYSDFLNWSYEYMMGDETDKIISESKQQRINSNTYKNLSTDSRYDLTEGFTRTFAYMENGLMVKQFRPGNLIMCLFLFPFISLHCYFMVFYDSNKKYKGAVECTAGDSERNCLYCGGGYVIGTTINCPHCGAPISTESENYY